MNHRHRTRLNALLDRDPETLFILWIFDMHVKVRFTRIRSLQALIHPPWLTPCESILVHRPFHDRCLRPRSPYPGRTGSELEISGGRRGGGILGITSWTAIRHNLTTLTPAPHKRGIPEIRNDGPISGTGLWLFGHYLARGAMRLREPRGASTPDRE